jgi:2-dehydropantoate 2-reductase
MNIGIIGAGSIGLLFASYLSKAFSITLYTRTIEQAEEINQNGILLQKGEIQSRIIVKAFPLSMWKGTEELSIIAVKQYQLRPIIEYLTKLECIPKNLLFLQNGMSHLALLEKVDAAAILVGSVEHGASKINSYSVRHNGEGAVNIAVFKGKSSTLSDFAEACAEIHFPLTIKEDYYQMLVNKLIANAVINPLTALLQVKNGELISNTFYFSAVKKLFLEISSILNLEDPIKKFRDIINICKKTGDNQSSMLKDVKAGRKTEIDSILGFLLDEGAKQQKTAVNIETYYLLLKGKEQTRGEVK